MMIQNATKPAFAPNVVVAISSPDPTIEAERINPGPKNFNLPAKEVGGSFAVNPYVSLMADGAIL